MELKPLVSVVCLCYNHEKYVREAIESVLNQTYKNIQLIVVDDCSNDGSSSVINQVKVQNPEILFLQLKENVGNCAAFNMGLTMVRGDFVIDFATDDVMTPDRIEKQVNQFSKLDDQFGVVFSNADYIDEEGRFLRNHTRHLLDKKLISRVPEGWIFRDLLSRYFISAPTMMIRKKVFEDLNGYDENLNYEDFDFWVRSSRNFKYAYLDEVLTKVRVNSQSMSSKQYSIGDRQLHSTFLVCQKAIKLCRDDEERKALLARIRYEFRQAIFSNKKAEAKLLGKLELEISDHSWQFYFFTALSWVPLPWSWIRKKYQQVYYG
jgi:glycosyltransferase involved in cell wall biosynthesis